MGTRKKGGSRLKRTLFILALLGVILSIAFLFAVYLFLKSPVFVEIVENTLRERLEKDVEIGSITFTRRPGVIIRDLVIRKGAKGSGPLVILPRLEIKVSLTGLLQKGIDNVYIKSPEVFLTLEESKELEKEEPAGPLPFFIKRTSIEDARGHIQIEKERTFVVGPATLSIEESPEKKADLRGEVFLPPINSSVSIDAKIDTNRLDIESGQLDIGMIELETLSAGGVDILRDMKISGSVKLGLDVLRGAGGGIAIELTGIFENLGVSRNDSPLFSGKGSGNLTALLTVSSDYGVVDVKVAGSLDTPSSGKDLSLVTSLSGTYDVKGSALEVENASLSSPALGTVDLDGRIKNLPSKDVSGDLNLRVKKISLSGLNDLVLRPLGIGQFGLEYSGILSGTAGVKGSLAEGAKGGGGGGGFGWHTDFSIGRLSVDYEKVKLDLKGRPVSLASKGSYNIKEDLLKLESLKARLGHLRPLNIKGYLKNVSSGDPDISLTIKAEEIPVKEMKGLVSDSILKWPDAVDIRGLAGAEIEVKGKISSPLIKVCLHAKGNSVKADLMELKPFEAGAKVEYRGDGFVLRDAVITGGAAELISGKGAGFRTKIKRPELKVTFVKYKGSILSSGNFIFKAERAFVTRKGEEPYEVEGTTLTGSIYGDIKRRFLRLKDMTINAGPLKMTSKEVSLDLNEPVTLKAALNLKGLDLERLWPGFSHLFSPIQGFSVKGKGQMRTVFQATIHEGSLSSVTGRAHLSIAQGGFSSPDGTMIGEGGEGIVLEIASSFKLTLPELKLGLSLSAGAKDFELLLGSFYGEFRDKALGFTFEGEYIKQSDSIQVSRASLSLTEVGTIVVSGLISELTGDTTFDTVLSLKELSNRGAYELFIRETFQESFPVLSRLNVDGMTSVELSARGTKDRFKAGGRIKVTDMNIIAANGSGPSVTGINISLPFDLSYPLSYPKIASPEGEMVFGSVVIKDVSWGALDFRNLELYPAVHGNSLVLREEVLLPVFGGTIRVREVNYKDLLSPGRELNLSLDIEDIDLSEASMALGLPRFSGTFSGTIPKVSFVGSRLATEGEVLLKLFGGEMRVREISINNVFSPAVSLKSTVEIKDIDLGKLTDTFEFGRITGIFEGIIKDLVIVDGQPESFVAHFETVKRRGVVQKISSEAVEKISILGTGSAARVLNRGIYQFFKEYRYKKMGFSGWLRNDRFLLLGIEMVGNKGYIVKGGLLPPKVNVINYTQNISFKELVKRLNRIKLIGRGGLGGGSRGVEW